MDRLFWVLNVMLLVTFIHKGFCDTIPGSQVPISLYQNSCLKVVSRNTFLIVICLYLAIEAAGIVPVAFDWYLSVMN